MAELKPCPFCGKKLIFEAGKRLNRYYNGEPTRYFHSYTGKCVMDGFIVHQYNWEKWNKRVKKI